MKKRLESKRCGDWTPQDTPNGIESKKKTGNWIVFSLCDNVGVRITDNYRKPAEQRQKDELKPLELQNAEEFIIQEVQSKV